MLLLADTDDVASSIGSRNLSGHWTQGQDGPSGTDIEVRVIEGGRLDTLAQRAGGEPPPEIDIPRGLEDWFASQTGRWPPEPATLIVLSASPTLTEKVLRHRKSGWLAAPPPNATPEQRAWLEENFDASPPDTVAIGDALAQLDSRLGEGTELLVYNVSTYIPDERSHWLRPGEPEPMSLLANRLDLVLDRTAAQGRFHVVDVDRIVAEIGAGEAVLGPARYSPEAYGTIAAEVMATLSDLPGLSTRLGLDVMRLEVPGYDRRTTDGVLVKWHVDAPCRVAPGEALFDLRFDNVRARFGGREGVGRTLLVQVVAVREGYLREVGVDAGEPVSVGSAVGTVTESDHGELGPVAPGVRFPVGVKVVAR